MVRPCPSVVAGLVELQSLLDACTGRGMTRAAGGTRSTFRLLGTPCLFTGKLDEGEASRASWPRPSPFSVVPLLPALPALPALPPLFAFSGVWVRRFGMLNLPTQEVQRGTEAQQAHREHLTKAWRSRTPRSPSSPAERATVGSLLRQNGRGRGTWREGTGEGTGTATGTGTASRAGSTLSWSWHFSQGKCSSFAARHIRAVSTSARILFASPCNLRCNASPTQGRGVMPKSGGRPGSGMRSSGKATKQTQDPR